MKTSGVFLLKCLGVAVALMAGQMIGGMIMGLLAQVPPPGHDGPFDGTQAMLIFNIASALVIGAIAENLRWNGWKKGLILSVAFFVVATLLSQVEAFYFAAYVKLSTHAIIVITLTDTIRAVLAGVVAALLWRNGDDSAADRFGGLFWKIPVLSLLYVVVYFGAGALIAWQGAAVRAYYLQGQHIDPGQLALLQVGRGAIWVGIALMLAKAMTGSAWRRGLLVGLAFAVFMAVQLLFPISFMPWAVREFHLMEVFSSNLLYGVVATLILMLGWKKPS